MENNNLMNFTAEQLEEMLKKAKENEKKEKTGKWEKREKVLMKETDKIKKPDLVKLYVELKVKEEKRLEINEKRKGTNKKKTTESGKCCARKCIRNEDLENEKYAKIKGYKWNDFKPCGKKCKGGKFCETHQSEAESLACGKPRDGIWGEKWEFPTHTLKPAKEWVKMIYELHPEIKPVKEKKEEEKPKVVEKPKEEEKEEEEEEEEEEEQSEEEEEESEEEEEEEEKK